MVDLTVLISINLRISQPLKQSICLMWKILVDDFNGHNRLYLLNYRTPSDSVENTFVLKIC